MHYTQFKSESPNPWLLFIRAWRLIHYHSKVSAIWEMTTLPAKRKELFVSPGSAAQCLKQWIVLHRASENIWEKFNFSFVSRYQLGIASGLGEGAHVGDQWNFNLWLIFSIQNPYSHQSWVFLRWTRLIVLSSSKCNRPWWLKAKLSSYLLLKGTSCQEWFRYRHSCRKR